MINFAGTPERTGDWAWFISLVTAKKLAVQYEENVDIYRIYSYDGPEVLTCVIWKGTVAPTVAATYSQAQNDSDKSDFETNYKLTANQSVVPRSGDRTPKVAVRTLQHEIAPFLSELDGSEPMHVNGTSGGTVEIIWNGTGGGDTGGDWTQGGDAGQTETVAAMHSGTNGLDTGSRGVNDVTSFDNGSTIDVKSLYAEVTFWMNPQAYPGNGQTQVTWRAGDDSQIGGGVLVNNYVSNMDLGVWQKVTIPIADFSLPDTPLPQKLRFKYGPGNNQHFYWDDIELVAAGGAGQGATVFRFAAPDATVCYHVERICLVLSASTTGWDANKFGVLTALDSGLLLRHYEPNASPDPITRWKVNVKDNAQLYGQYQEWNAASFDTQRLITMTLEPTVGSVQVSDQAVLDFLVRDDLSGLVDLRAYVHYGVEIIQ